MPATRIPTKQQHAELEMQLGGSQHRRMEFGGLDPFDGLQLAASGAGAKQREQHGPGQHTS